MMESIREFVLSLICVSLISGILTDIFQKTRISKQIKVISSFFIALTFLTPLIRWKYPTLEQLDGFYSLEAQKAVNQGEQIRIQSVAAIIKSQTEAYLLKEAKSIGADISVDIALGNEDPPIPVSSTIKGFFDATSESTLSRILTQELGIPKENQTWIRQEVQSGSS